jgi:hypothetical protein
MLDVKQACRFKKRLTSFSFGGEMPRATDSDVRDVDFMRRSVRLETGFEGKRRHTKSVSAARANVR